MGLVQSSAAMFMFMFMFMLLRFTLSSASEMSIISYDQNHGPSPLGAPVVCDNHVSCPESNTCCCISESSNVCLQWGCCPLEDATCCDDRASCCPRDYPICDLDKGVCLRSKGNPLGVKAMRRTPAKPHWAVGAQAKKSSA